MDMQFQWPARFNLCEYYLDHNVEAGRANKTAVIVGDTRRPYAEVLARVRRLTAWLRASGLKPEERVLLALPDGHEFVEAWLAILRAGGVFAMVNPLLKAADYEKYLRYTRARVLVTHSDVLPEI